MKGLQALFPWKAQNEIVILRWFNKYWYHQPSKTKHVVMWCTWIKSHTLSKRLAACQFIQERCAETWTGLQFIQEGTKVVIDALACRPLILAKNFNRCKVWRNCHPKLPWKLCACEQSMALAGSCLWFHVSDKSMNRKHDTNRIILLTWQLRDETN